MIYIKNKVKWAVIFHRQVVKALPTLPEAVCARFGVLSREIEELGPVRGNWKNYGKLLKNQHHCHLRAGRPTYVACWEVLDLEKRIVEVYYVGTHEKAPY